MLEALTGRQGGLRRVGAFPEVATCRGRLEPSERLSCAPIPSVGVPASGCVLLNPLNDELSQRDGIIQRDSAGCPNHDQLRPDPALREEREVTVDVKISCRDLHQEPRRCIAYRREVQGLEGNTLRDKAERLGESLSSKLAKHLWIEVSEDQHWAPGIQWGGNTTPRLPECQLNLTNQP